MPDNTQPNHPLPDAEPSPHRGAPFIDRRTTPLGVLPRHLQLWVLIGIAIVMVGIMSFSSTRTPPRPTSPGGGVPSTIDPNQQRIQEYEQRIQEQAQRLAAEQAGRHVAQDALGGPSGPTQTG